MPVNGCCRGLLLVLLAFFFGHRWAIRIAPTPESDRTLPSGGIILLLFWSVLGAAGASVVYAVNPSPALGVRSKNAAGVVVAALIGAALWQAGVAGAWTFPEAWCGTFLLLWGSQFEVGLDDLTWVRAVAATGLVVLLAQIFR